MSKKLLLLGVLFCLVINSLYSATEEDLRKAIKQERTELVSLLEEIAFLSALVEDKLIARELYQNKNYEELNAIFKQQANELQEALDEQKIEKVEFNLNKLKHIYKDIEPISPFLLFYEAKYHLAQKDYDNAQILLEDIIFNYPEFENFAQTAILLQEIYFRKGMHEELISLNNRFKSQSTEKQKFWLAHSYYNVENYQKAVKMFEDLQSNKTFTTRCQEMLALISLYTEGLDTAIANFQQLENTINPDDIYYSFIYLTLARLNIKNGYFKEGLAYYDKYVENFQGIISDEILFEIAIQNKNYEYYDKALAYFRVIINRANDNQYYMSARILSTITKQESGHYQNLEAGLKEVILQKDVLIQTLKAKYQLVDKYDSLRVKLKDGIGKEEQKSIATKLETIENVILKTTNTLNQLYSGEDPKSVAVLKAIEEEYIFYNITLDMMDAIIALAQNRPNKRIPKLINHEITYADSSMKILEVMKYLGHKRNITLGDYKLARALIDEKEFEENLLEVWDNIKKMAQKNNQDVIAKYAETSKFLIEQNLASLELISKYSFGGEPSENFKEMINAEMASMQKNKQELEKLKKEVIAKLNKKIANRLNNQRELLTSESSHLKNFYSKVLDKIVEDVKTEKENNTFTLLDILFKQTKAMDSEYEAKQEQKSNE